MILEVKIMDRIPVSSSNIADIGYDPSAMILEIGFRSGSVYQYFDVPQAVYEEFMRAESKGRFFHAHIENNYRYIKL